MSASVLRKLVRNFPENGPKLLLENPANVHDLLMIVGAPAVDAIDFTAMTVERTHFVKPDYAHVALDLLLKAPFRGSAETILIYILVEHQSSPERFFQLRLAEYVLEAYKMQKRAWDEQHDGDAEFFLNPVLPVVLYTGERSWRKIETLSELVHEGSLFDELIPHFKPRFLNLRETPQSALEQGGFFGQVLRLIQQQRTEPDVFRRTLHEVMTALEQMPRLERTRWVEFLSYAVALVYHARREPEHAELREVVECSVRNDPHRKEFNMTGRTIAEMFMDQGREEEAIKSRREVLLRQLRKRFKKVPTEVKKRITATTDVQDLDGWLDRVVDAETLDDVGIK